MVAIISWNESKVSEPSEKSSVWDLSVVDRVFHSLALNGVFNYDLTADSMTNTVMSRQ